MVDRSALPPRCGGTQGGSICLLLLLLCSPLCAQEPIIGFLLNANRYSLGYGGNLMNIGPTYRPGFGWGGPRIECEVRADYADYYRLGALERDGAAFRRNVGLFARYFRNNNRFPWYLGLAGVDRATQFGYSSSTAGQSYLGGTSRVSGELTAGVSYKSTTLIGGRLNAKESSVLEPTVFAEYNGRRVGQYLVGYQRRTSPLAAMLGWRENLATLDLTGRRDGYDFRARTPCVLRFRLSALVTRSQYVRDDETSLATTLEPWGDAWSWHALISRQLKRMMVYGGVRGSTLDAQAYGVKGDLPYAKITTATADLNTQFVGCDLPLANGSGVAEIEHLDWTAYARGHTEFWPFTSGFVDLLGLRRYFIANTGGNLWRAHIGYRTSLSKRWNFATGLNALEIYPHATLDHWRPEYLIFGKADEQIHEFPFRRILAGAVSGGLTCRAKQFTVGYSFLQAFPVKTWSRPTAPSEPSVPSGSSSRSRAYGGAIHQLSITFTL